VAVTVSAADQEVPLWSLADPIARLGGLPERRTEEARRLVELSRERPGDELAEAILAALECACEGKGWFVMLGTDSGDLEIDGCDDCGLLTDEQAGALPEAQEALSAAVARAAAANAQPQPGSGAR
jgi:hypothetical protein